MALCSPVISDECNFFATLIEVESFYLTQKYSKNVSINLKEYVEAFPKLDKLVDSFSENLANYENEASIDASEPLALIPFSDDLNAYKISDLHPGKDAFKACFENGGSLIDLTSKNRAKVASILKDQEMEKTPISALPFFSLFSNTDKEVLDTPTDFDSIKSIWNRSPPMLGADNQLTYPKTKKENSEVHTTPEEYKSQILCFKPNNPWDIKGSNRNSWFKIVPKLKSTLSLLAKLKHSYDLSVKVLKNTPRSATKVTDLLKLSLPEPFRDVLGFMDKLKEKKAWEKLQGDANSKFYKFMQTASKLARMFNLKPNSLTQLSESRSRFTPPSIIEINWRDHLGLDEELYGITGPVTISPNFAHAKEDEVVPTLFNALVDARIFNRQTDKITLYRVKPNVYKQEAANVKMILKTPQIQVAVSHEIEPIQCEMPPTEIHRVCHRLPFQLINKGTLSELSKCAEALSTTEFDDKFFSCPRLPVEKGLVIYRAECGSKLEPTVIVNSDQPVLLDFVCDGVKTVSKNFTTFPSYLHTNCEVLASKGQSQQVILPQFNHDFLQDPSVGSIFTPSLPPAEPITLVQILIISALCSAAAVVLTALAILLIWTCRRKIKQKKRQSKKRNHSIEEPQHQVQPFIPFPIAQELQSLEYQAQVH